MLLTGDLKHFPIIDIIQLLHGSRKSGVLRLSGERGESQLVFHEGGLVSANYLNSRVRIGQVLVSAGAITEDQLVRALEIQESAGDRRQPLVNTLLEQGMVDETEAYNCLESLIEMTIIEVMTWKEGRFSLEMGAVGGTDGYRFSKTSFPQRILLNSQGVLMEALRIYDEKVREGSMDEILSIAGVDNLDLELEQPGSAAGGGDREGGASALQQMLARQREMVRHAGDQEYRSVDAMGRMIVDEFPSATKEQKLELLSLLAGPVVESGWGGEPRGMAVIVVTLSPLLSTMVRSICYQEGVYAIATDDISSVDMSIRLLLCQALRLVVILDVPHDETTVQENTRSGAELRKYPQVSLVLAACSRFWSMLGMQALGSGIHSVIPRPCRECGEETYLRQALAFCSGLGTFLRSLSSEYVKSGDQRFFSCVSRLGDCRTLVEIADGVLAYLMEPFERGIVFLVTEAELVAEHSFGVAGEKGEGGAHLSTLCIPPDDQEIFEDVVKTGNVYYGFHSDSTWPHQLYRLIGRPDSPEVLLFPLVRANRVVAFIYADFGSRPAIAPLLDQIEALLRYSSAQINIVTYRQKLRTMMERQRREEQATTD
jgi:hypothetical protein